MGDLLLFDGNLVIEPLNNATIDLSKFWDEPQSVFKPEGEPTRFPKPILFDGGFLALIGWVSASAYDVITYGYIKSPSSNVSGPVSVQISRNPERLQTMPSGWPQGILAQTRIAPMTPSSSGGDNKFIAGIQGFCFSTLGMNKGFHTFIFHEFFGSNLSFIGIPLPISISAQSIHAEKLFKYLCIGWHMAMCVGNVHTSGIVHENIRPSSFVVAIDKDPAKARDADVIPLIKLSGFNRSCWGCNAFYREAQEAAVPLSAFSKTSDIMSTASVPNPGRCYNPFTILWYCSKRYTEMHNRESEKVARLDTDGMLVWYGKKAEDILFNPGMPYLQRLDSLRDELYCQEMGMRRRNDLHMLIMSIIEIGMKSSIQNPPIFENPYLGTSPQMFGTGGTTLYRRLHNEGFKFASNGYGYNVEKALTKLSNVMFLIISDQQAEGLLSQLYEAFDQAIRSLLESVDDATRARLWSLTKGPSSGFATPNFGQEKSDYKPKSAPETQWKPSERWKQPESTPPPVSKSAPETQWKPSERWKQAPPPQAQAKPAPAQAQAEAQAQPSRQKRGRESSEQPLDPKKYYCVKPYASDAVGSTMRRNRQKACVYGSLTSPESVILNEKSPSFDLAECTNLCTRPPTKEDDEIRRADLAKLKAEERFNKERAAKETEELRARGVLPSKEEKEVGGPGHK